MSIIILKGTEIIETKYKMLQQGNSSFKQQSKVSCKILLALFRNPVLYYLINFFSIDINLAQTDCLSLTLLKVPFNSDNSQTSSVSQLSLSLLHINGLRILETHQKMTHHQHINMHDELLIAYRAIVRVKTQ